MQTGSAESLSRKQILATPLRESGPATPIWHLERSSLDARNSAKIDPGGRQMRPPASCLEALQAGRQSSALLPRPPTCQRLGSGWATGPATKTPLPARVPPTCKLLEAIGQTCATNSTFRPGIQVSEPAHTRRKSGAPAGAARSHADLLAANLPDACIPVRLATSAYKRRPIVPPRPFRAAAKKVTSLAPRQERDRIVYVA